MKPTSLSLDHHSLTLPWKSTAVSRVMLAEVVNKHRCEVLLTLKDAHRNHKHLILKFVKCLYHDDR